jgi:hypothetical protein
MKGSRFDWYQPTDADFIDELVATVIDVVNVKRSTRGLTPEQTIARAEEERLIAYPTATPMDIAHLMT